MMTPFKSFVAAWIPACILLTLFASTVSGAYPCCKLLMLQPAHTRFTASYFVIEEPQLQTQWQNNAVNLVTWRKGVLDGIDGFDVEMARLSQNGLILVARNSE